LKCSTMKGHHRLFVLLAIVIFASGAAVPLLQEPEGAFRVVWKNLPEGMPLTLCDGARYRDLAIERVDGGGVPVSSEGAQVDTSFVGLHLVNGLADDAGKPVGRVKFEAGRAAFDACQVTGPITVDGQTVSGRHVAGFWSLAAPLMAILLAILLREVLLALLLGIWAGVIALEGELLAGTLRTIDRHLIGALTDGSHIKILVFSCTLGGVVAMISRMGGVRAMVEALARRGRTGRAAQLTTWLTGVLVFFDDYANALLVGNTMRPVTDRYGVSREKLAYLVDSTSAPVACIAPVSTWIVAEVGYINDWLEPHLERVSGESFAGYSKAYPLFLDSITYNFYPILALVFGAMIVWMRRDFGPMLAAERRAASGELMAKGARPLASAEMDAAEPVDPERLRWWNGALPIMTLVLVVICGLYLDGVRSIDEAESL